MSQLLSKPDRPRYPLECIKPWDFMRKTEEQKKEIISIRTTALNDLLHKKYGDKTIEIQVRPEFSDIKNIMLLNRKIRALRNDPWTVTTIVIKILDELKRIYGEGYKHTHRDVQLVLEDVPIPSIRRIISQYNRGLLG
jgi:hypothetical protein